MNFRCLLFLFLLSASYFSHTFSQSVLTRKDTLYEILANPVNDTAELDAYIEIVGWYYITDPDSAIYFAKKGLELARHLQSEIGIAYSCGWLAYVYEQKSQMNESLNFNLIALESYSKLADSVGVSISLNNIGLIHMRRGDFEEAYRFLEKSIATAKSAGYNSGLGSGYGNIGYICMEQGDNKKALEYLFQSAHYNLIDSNFHGLGISYTKIGSIFSEEKKYDEAIIYFEKSLAIKQNVVDNVVLAGTYTNLGFLYAEKGEFETANNYYNKAFSIATDIDKQDVIATIYSNRSVLEFRKKNYDLAKELSLKALKIAHSIGYPALIRKILNVIIKVNKELKLFSENEIHFLEILRINNKSVSNNFSMLTEKEKELYFNSLSQEYEDFYSYVLFSKDRNESLTDKVYDAVISNKGFLLKSNTAMRTAIFSSSDSTLIKLYNEWLTIKKKLAQNYSTGVVDEILEKRANELEKELVQKSLEFSKVSETQKIRWTDVRDNLKEDEAAIEFIHFKHSMDTTSGEENIVYCALIVTSRSEHPQMIELFKETELKSILGDFPGNNLSYIENLYGSKNKPSSALYDLIWEPIESKLTGISTVYLSPSGLLHKISFAALSKNHSVFLCDRYDIKQQSNTAQIVFSESVVFDNQSTFSIFGGINYDSDMTEKEVWTYLEGTKLETAQIKLFLDKKNWHPEYLTDEYATEEQVKLFAPKSNILHIATHGFFYPEPSNSEIENETETEELNFRGGSKGFSTFVENTNPLMRSGIVFAGANRVWNSSELSEGEDGVLTAQEVAVMDLRNTKLVVLSACETGLGDIKGTEGVYGLQRAFKMAGVKYIIMSLWKVPDKETAEFMITFYRYLVKTENVRNAFLATQKKMKESKDPYYWGAFVLIE